MNVVYVRGVYDIVILQLLIKYGLKKLFEYYTNVRVCVLVLPLLLTVW